MHWVTLELCYGHKVHQLTDDHKVHQLTYARNSREIAQSAPSYQTLYFVYSGSGRDSSQMIGVEAVHNSRIHLHSYETSNMAMFRFGSAWISYKTTCFVFMGCYISLTGGNTAGVRSCLGAPVESLVHLRVHLLRINALVTPHNNSNGFPVCS